MDSQDIKYPTHLVIGRTTNYGDLFNITNLIDPDQFEVMELFPVGNGGHIILEVLEENAAKAQDLFKSLKESVTSAKVDLTEFDIFFHISEEILDSYLGLNSGEMASDTLLVAETHSLVKAFKTATLALKNGASIQDLRFLKGSNPKVISTFGNLTGKLDLEQEIHQTYLAEVNETTRNYFRSITRINNI